MSNLFCPILFFAVDVDIRSDQIIRLLMAYVANTGVLAMYVVVM